MIYIVKLVVCLEKITMNDFTKEELKEILYCITHYQSCKWSNPELLQLESKIKSMIDNYCEHEWRCWDDEHNTKECTKCDESRTGEIND